MEELKKITRRVKWLCEILEVDHFGLISEGLERLMNKYNEAVAKVLLLKNELEIET